MMDCPRAKSDMTPCVLKEGEVCRTADDRCAGCNYMIAALSDKEILMMKAATRRFSER